MKSLFSKFAIAIMFLASGGCGSGTQGPQTGTVSGKVTLKGTSFSEGRVSLYSTESGSGALLPLNEAGEYRTTDLLIVGDYQVSIRPPELPEPQPGKPPVTPKTPAQGGIPTKYRSAESSNLILKIAPGKNTFDVKMAP